MSLGLEGKAVLVTGAARGIGLAISERFRELGARVCGWDFDCSPLAAHPGFDLVQRVDVTDEDAVEAAYGEAERAFGGLDVIIANAGVNGATAPAWEYSLSEWKRVLDVDLTGVFLTTRPAVRAMRRTGEGRIVIIASVAGKEGNPGACAYGAAKAGVIGYAKGLARELMPSNITVNCIAPVITETDLLLEMSAEYIADKKRRIPMNRFCTAEEIADMTVFVASPRCSFTTGQVFDLTGGRATY